MSSRMMSWLARIDTDEILSKAGLNRTALYTLRADPEVRQCLETRADSVAGVPWRLEPANHPYTVAFQTSLQPWWDRMVRGICDAVPFGYSVVQFVLDSTTGLPLVSACLQQPFEEYQITVGGEWRKYPSTGEGGSQGLKVSALDTIITVRRPTGKYPYGDALLSSLYWPVFFKREGMVAWLKFVERFGTPILVGKVFNPDSFVAAMNAGGFETVFGVQPTEDITAMLAGQGGELEQMQEQLIRVIQRVILGQTLTSDIGSSGSYAAAKVHDLVREDKRNADIRLVKSSVQTWLNLVFTSAGQQPPLLVLADDTGLEQDRATRDSTLTTVLSASGLRFSKGYYTDRYDIRETDLEEVVEVKANASVRIPAEPQNNKPVDEDEGTEEHEDTAKEGMVDEE
jgi:phage gp29-like protein